jgi:hypothetical protein
MLNVPPKNNEIFLSSKTGAPMAERALSQSIRQPCAQPEHQKGKSIHAVRELFAGETLREEELLRREAGLDTSAASLAMATAWKLGQKNPESLFPYVSQELSRIAHAKKRERRLKRPPER